MPPSQSQLLPPKPQYPDVGPVTLSFACADAVRTVGRIAARPATASQCRTAPRRIRDVDDRNIHLWSRTIGAGGEAGAWSNLT